MACYTISEEPTHHSDCCVAISSRLLDLLTEILPRSPRLTLSIGSGTGLLEAALIDWSNRRLIIRGVEASPSINKYLEPEDLAIVGTTSTLYVIADIAAAWMFVYPRSTNLVSRYLRLFDHERLQSVVWIGPRNDWPEYEEIIETTLFGHSEGGHVEEIHDAGVAAYEMVVLCRKNIEHV